MEHGSGTLQINHCEVSPWVIASVDFNRQPLELAIAGVYQTNRRFFRTLDGIVCAERRGEIFHDYLSVKFMLHQWENFDGTARKSLRNSYIRFLRGWGVDSSSVEGAVLKGWVQSRFGVMPTYHRHALSYSGNEEDAQFAYDRMKGGARTNAIFSQLDLLYTFCQYELKRRRPGCQHFTLFRGTNDAEEHPRVATVDRRHYSVRLNNLCSFTSDREAAWEFGSTVWQAEVPVCKIVFFSELLPTSLLKGEGEYLVIGGEFDVIELLY